MPIQKAPPPKKFDPSNVDTKTGKPKVAPKQYAPEPKSAPSGGGSTFHPVNAPVEVKPTPQPTNTIREAITATQRRESAAGT